MNVGIISKRYAKSLLEYAQGQSAEDVIYQEMKKLADTFSQEPRLRMAMDNPILTVKDKLELLKAVVGNNPSPQFIRFIELVLKNRRELYLQRIALSYENMYRQFKNINTARLITASPVDDAVLVKIKALLSKIKPGILDLETSIDHSIEGGFVLFVDTYRLDASVASQLKKIRNQFITENSKII